MVGDQESFLRNFDRVEPGDELPFFLRDFKIHLWNGHDVEHRPFGELLASAKAREGVEFEIKPSKYPGVRNGAGINLSGLRPMTEHWQAILADVDFVRARFLARAGVSELTWGHLWQLSKTLAGMPSFIFARNGNSEVIPVRVSGMFRAVIGIVSVVEGMLAEGVSPLAKAETKPILEIAEQGAFMSEGGRACAGPIHMVEGFTDALIKGVTAKESSAVEELVGDVDQFLEYGEEGQRWDLANQLYRAGTRLVAETAVRLFTRLELDAHAADNSRGEAWAQLQRTAIPHLDLAWFSINVKALTSEQVRAAIPLIEMFLGVEPSQPRTTAIVPGLAELLGVVVPWAPREHVAELAECWNDYLAHEQRLAHVYFRIQETTDGGLHKIGGRQSPLIHSSGPYQPRGVDFSKRLGATLGDLFATAFRFRVESTSDGGVLLHPDRIIS